MSARPLQKPYFEWPLNILSRCTTVYLVIPLFCISFSQNFSVWYHHQHSCKQTTLRRRKPLPAAVFLAETRFAHAHPIMPTQSWHWEAMTPSPQLSTRASRPETESLESGLCGGSHPGPNIPMLASGKPVGTEHLSPWPPGPHT